MGYLLRYEQEIRKPDFSTMKKVEIGPELIELAEQLIENERGGFDPTLFKDEYGEALLALINRKAKTAVVRSSSEGVATNVANLMDALKKSVATSNARRPARAAASHKRAPFKRASVRKAG